MILVVEADPSLRSALAQALGQGSNDVLALESLEAARMALATYTPDLLAVNARLPDGSGVELARSLGPQRRRRVAVVVWGDGVDRALAVAAGATDVLDRPFLLDELVRLLRCGPRSRRLQGARSAARRRRRAVAGLLTIDGASAS